MHNKYNSKYIINLTTPLEFARAEGEVPQPLDVAMLLSTKNVGWYSFKSPL
jgi:hypothetical protein